jgi:hypothetical protein
MRTSYLIALLCGLFLFMGCPAGDDDDDDMTGDDDAQDDDVTGDDDDDATADDDDDDDDATADDDDDATADDDDDTDPGVLGNTGDACVDASECGGIVNGTPECLIGIAPGGEGWENFVNGYCTGGGCTPGSPCDAGGVGECVQMLYWNPGERYCLKPCTHHNQCHDGGPGQPYGCEGSITTGSGSYCFPQG